MLIEEHQWYYFTQRRWRGIREIRDKEKSQKVSVIAQLKFEPAYFDAAVYHSSDYKTATELFEIELFWRLTVCKQNLYFELELFI